MTIYSSIGHKIEPLSPRPDVHHAGVFVWAESEAGAGHTNWADGEPWSPGPEEDCVVKD